MASVGRRCVLARCARRRDPLTEDPPRRFCSTKPARWDEAVLFIAGTNRAVLVRLMQIKLDRLSFWLPGAWEESSRQNHGPEPGPSVLNIPG
jgi:hypothetical protein